MEGHHQNARQIVLTEQIFLFGKIPNELVAVLIWLRQNVENEWLNVKIKSLVVKEELCHVAQVFAIHPFLLPVYFEHGEFPVLVDLVPWGAPCGAIFRMPD